MFIVASNQNLKIHFADEFLGSITTDVVDLLHRPKQRDAVFTINVVRFPVMPVWVDHGISAVNPDEGTFLSSVSPTNKRRVNTCDYKGITIITFRLSL